MDTTKLSKQIAAAITNFGAPGKFTRRNGDGTSKTLGTTNCAFTQGSATLLGPADAALTTNDSRTIYIIAGTWEPLYGDYVTLKGQTWQVADVTYEQIGLTQIAYKLLIT